MNIKGIKNFLSCLGVSKFQISDEWVHCSCPLAPWNHTGQTDKNPSFGVRVVPNGDSYYNCWSCGGGVSLEVLLGRLRMNGAKAPKYQLAKATDVLIKSALQHLTLDIKPFEEDEPDLLVEFPLHWINTFHPAVQVQKARNYLHGRNLSDTTIGAFNFRWDSSKEVVAAPIYDFMGRCRGLHGRFLNPPTNSKGVVMRYYSYGYEGARNMQVWLGEHWLNSDIPVIMVESIFDAAAVWPVYPNVIAPLAAGINEKKIKRIKYKVGDIVTFFDAGKAGVLWRDTIQAGFGSQVKEHIIPPEGSDPGDYSAKTMTLQLDAVLDKWT